MKAIPPVIQKLSQRLKVFKSRSKTHNVKFGPKKGLVTRNTIKIPFIQNVKVLPLLTKGPKAMLQKFLIAWI
jgi:hypothetical protein